MNSNQALDRRANFLVLAHAGRANFMEKQKDKLASFDNMQVNSGVLARCPGLCSPSLQARPRCGQWTNCIEALSGGLIDRCLPQ